MTDTTAETTTQLRLAVLSTDYSVLERPNQTESAAFWTSDNEEDRTFFVLSPEGRLPFIVVHVGDPRAEGLRVPYGSDEAGLMETAGLDTEEHRVWSIDPASALRFLDEEVEERPTLDQISTPYGDPDRPLVVGDRVKVIDSGGGHGLELGDEAEVIALDESDQREGTPLITIRVTSGRREGGTYSRYGFRLARIESAPEPEHVLAPGDRVRVTGDSDNRSNEGKFAIIDRLFPGRQPYLVRYEEGQGSPQEGITWYVESVEYAPIEESFRERFPVGSTFTFKEAARGGHGGETFTVEGYLVDEEGTTTVEVLPPRSCSLRRFQIEEVEGEVLDPLAPERVHKNVAKFPVGHWFSWGSAGQWYRVASVDPANGDLTADRSGFNTSGKFDPNVPDDHSVTLTWQGTAVANFSDLTVVPLRPGTAPAEAGLAEQVTRLTAELAEAKAAHEKDIADVGAALIKEACDRGWCSEYDEVIEYLNSNLTVPLPDRPQRYDVVLTVTYTVGDIRIEAANEEEAKQKAVDQFNPATLERRTPVVTSDRAIRRSY